MIKRLLSRRYILFTLLVSVLCITFLSLALWQWDRHRIQKAEDAVYIAQLAQSPILLNQWTEIDQLLTMTDRAVTVNGRFDYTQQRLLKNQVSPLGQGVHLITPFVLDGTEQAVLVDRGWVELTADLATLDQETTVVFGRIRQSDRALNTTPPADLFRVSISDLQPQIPYPLLPIILVQSPLDSDTADTRPLRPTTHPTGTYNGSSLGYTVQWVAFALIFGVGYLFYVRRQEYGRL